MVHLLLAFLSIRVFLIPKLQVALAEYRVIGGDEIRIRSNIGCFDWGATIEMQPLGNTLSHSTSQIKLTAKENRLTKRSGCLNTFCFFPDHYKRLLSESSCSISRPCLQARRDMTTNRMSSNTDPTAKLNANSTTAAR